MIGGPLNYTFSAAGQRVNEPIMDLIETDEHERCTGPRHACGGVLEGSMPLCWFVSRQATKYRTTTNGTPSAMDHAPASGLARRRPYKRLTANRDVRVIADIRSCLLPREKPNPAADRTTGLGFSLRHTNGPLRWIHAVLHLRHPEHNTVLAMN